MQNASEGRRRFRFKTTLGRGGFGEVYLAEMTAPSGLVADVAVKVLHGGLDPRSQAARRLADEAHILAMLRHPSIVGVHDLAVIDGRVALVTEFVEGADLDACLEGPDPLPLGALLEAWAQVASALDAAHQATGPDGNDLGLLHRDVKPSNVRVGKHGQVKLLDFGIATGSGFDRGAATQTGALIGSFPYIPPERFRRKPLCPGSDFYALGCALVECLTGSTIFDAGDIAELVSIKVDREAHDAKVDAALRQVQDAPPGLVQLLRDLLAHEPGDRPDAARLIATLEDLAADAGGPRLARWARGRAWDAPEGGLEAGPLCGREVFEAVTGSTIAVPDAPTGRRAAPTFDDEASPESAPAATPEPPVRIPAASTPRPAPVAEAAPVSASPRRPLGAFALLLLPLAAAVIAGGVLVGAGVTWWVRAQNAAPPVAVQVADVDPDALVPAPPPTAPEPPSTEPDAPVSDPNTEAPAAPEDPTMAPSTMPTRTLPGPAPAVPEQEDGVADAALQATDAAVPAAVACGDTKALEPQAELGRLEPALRDCLAARSRDRGLLQTERKRASVVYLVDAEARCRDGACADYERQQDYHLDDIDASDPTMMLAWAAHLQRTGRADDARRWAMAALERRDQWGPMVHVPNVGRAHQIKALASSAAWQSASRDEARRLNARDDAIAWAEFLRQTDQDATDALDLCGGPAGSREICEKRVQDIRARYEVTIVSLPAGYQVTIDGEALGSTPIAAELTSGAHQLALTIDGRTVTRVVEVGPDSASRLTYDVAQGAWSVGR